MINTFLPGLPIMLKKLLIGLVALCLIAATVTAFTYTVARSNAVSNLQAKSKIVETSEGPIEYLRSGNDGPLVLHLHGSPGGFDVDPLPGTRTLSLSRPGYLRTPLDVGRSAQEQAAAYAALLDALEIDEKVFVYAISGGGPSAYEFAERYPKRVRGLIAVVAQSQSLPPEDAPALYDSDFNAWISLSLAELAGPASVVEVMFPKPEDQKAILGSETKQKALWEFLWSIWPFTLFEIGYENDMLQLADIDLPLRDIEVPVLIIHGTEDTDVPVEQAVYASEQIGEATLLLIDGADHLSIFFVHREEMMSEIAAFLGNH
jgi:pimeloyl-ACP methyl ester carboxylesterase